MIRMIRGKLIAAVSGAGAAVLVLIASLTEFADAQVNCQTIAAGPARTDCYIGIGRISSGKSEIAATTAQQQTNSAIYHQSTGKRVAVKRRRAVSNR
jgi:hypothetical protein